MEKIKVKKLIDTAILPTRGHSDDAGIDLYVCITDEDLMEYGEGNGIVLKPGDVYMFDTGIAFDLPEGYFGLVVVRSSIGIKKQLRLMNQAGVIDQGFKDSVKIALHNFGSEPQEIRHGDRIAQMILLPYVTFPIEEVDKLTDTERGTGGIGSTGR